MVRPLFLQGNCITGQARENETKFPSSILLSFFLSQRKESVHIKTNDPQFPAKHFLSRPLWDTIDHSVQASWLWRSTLRKKLLKKRNKRQGGVSQRVHDILISRLQINVWSRTQGGWYSASGTPVQILLQDFLWLQLYLPGAIVNFRSLEWCNDHASIRGSLNLCSWPFQCSN